MADSDASSRRHPKTFDQPLDLREFRYWPLYVYDLFHAHKDQYLRRAAVSIGCGVVEYLIGLAIAASGGLAATYIRTPAIYLLCAALMFYMGRAKWLGIEIIHRTIFIRDAFLVTDDTYYEGVKISGKRASPSQALPICLILICLVGGWLAVGLTMLDPYSPIGARLTALEPPTFGPEWFTGQDLVSKMLVIDYYWMCAILYGVPVLHGTAMLVVQLPALFSRWPLVPIPAYVSARFRTAQTFFFSGALFYAVAVLALVLLYGGKLDPLFFGLISVFVLIGLLCVLIPLYAVQRLVTRARDQLAVAVSADYRQAIQPVADGYGSSAAASVDVERYARLLKLQELMQAANETSGFERQLGVIVPAMLSQGIPYLGFLLSAILKHPT